MATKSQPSVPPTNSWHEDEIVEELHRHRAEIAERFDYDLKRIFEYYASTPIDPGVKRLDLPLVTPKRVAKSG